MAPMQGVFFLIRKFMRYLWNKQQLVLEIERIINNYCENNCKIFCDAFSWTATVWNFFKNKFKIIANDIQYYSYIISQAKLNTPDLKFKKLWIDPFDLFNNEWLEKKWFIYNNYSPAWGRQYFSEENALKIDYIRDKIEEWKNKNKITDNEYYYLIACLLESISKVANIAWVYWAYLKKRDPRAIKLMKFIKVEQYDESFYKKADIYNEKIEKLIKNISGDILYLDPPYTKNQYSVQYHLLETIAKNDNPEIKWKWWLRNTSETSSNWSKDGDVHVALDYIIAHANFKYIILSYNSDGLMSKKYIENIFKRYGKEETFKCIEIPYKQYKNHQTWEKECHYEYLFFMEKKPYSTVNYASPLNYQWGKYDLIEFIKKNLPKKKIWTFIDLFWWWYNVWININANKIIYNDINHKVVELMKTFHDTYTIDLVKYILRTKKQYKLEFWDKEHYIKLRDVYNWTPVEQRDPKMLYMLILYWFNQMVRFNTSYNYNNPVWPTWLNDNMLEKIISFCRRIQEQKIEFLSKYFDTINVNTNCFIYCDPPYLITMWSYNDWKRWFNWRTLEDEKKLYSFLEKLNNKWIKFMMSNVLEHKWKINSYLKERIETNWYKIIQFKWKARKGRKEILVVNY